MIALRPAGPEDIAAVLAFWAAATAEPSTTDDADAIATLLDRSPGALIVATEDDRIVGTVIAGWDGWRGTLYRLAVAPTFRRRGIATSLVTEAERFLQAQGARRLHLLVGRAGGPAAEAFWKSASYGPTDQLRMVKTVG